MQGLVDFRFLCFTLACLIIYLIIVGDEEEELSATVTWNRGTTYSYCRLESSEREREREERKGDQTRPELLQVVLRFTISSSGTQSLSYVRRHFIFLLTP